MACGWKYKADEMEIGVGKDKTNRKIYIRTILSFLFVFLLCLGVIIVTVQNQIKSEVLQIEQLILESGYRINEVISKQLYKTSALAALVIQGDGVVHNFEQVASVIASDMPAFANFLLAPDGVVTEVYPLEGNEAVVGLDFFNEIDHAGNREAILARDLDDLVMAGPFLLRQGIIGLVGRYPVYIDTETEQQKFWGLVSVSLKFPEALEDTGLSMLEFQDLSYELWRINPDTNEKQIIATGSKPFQDHFSYVEKPVRIHNAEWFFRVFPIRSWHERPETWFLLTGGLLISFLSAFLVQNNSILKTVKYDLEDLTGTLNTMAVTFLEKSNKTFSELMTEEVWLLADVIHIDRLSVWRHSVKQDGPYASQIYRWERSSGGTTATLEEFADAPYARYAPRWAEILTANEAINSPVRRMPDDEAQILKAHGTVSIFTTPVFIGDVFWGFVIFEDLRKERYFESSHTNFMNSAAFLFANAVMRDELEREIAESNEFNRILYDNAPVGINTFDKDFHFVDYNNRLLKLLGATEEKYDFLNDFSPEYQPDGMNSAEKAYQKAERTMNGENLVFEWAYQSASGEIIPCEITTTRIKYKGETMGLSYIYDIRHLKNMENKITQMESELAESKISIMLSQIQPHFLYNALTAIAQLCDENPVKAKKATIDFSTYLRSNMDSLTVKGLISVEKELQHVESYLNLEKAIYGSSLNVIFRIEAGGFFIPPLTIQPIVENAIKHGIGQKEGGGTVTVSVSETKMKYLITVTDNGLGYELNTPEKDARKKIGIDNVRQRLKEQCQGTLDMASEIDIGTTVVITIPKEGKA